MRILFAALPAFGHVYPLMPLALACRDQGHDVTMAAGAAFKDSLPLPTVLGMPKQFTESWMEEETERRRPDLAELHGPDKWRFGIEMFADTGAGVVAEGMLETLDQLRPDLVVYEHTNVGAAVAASVRSVPAVSFGITNWDSFPSTLANLVCERQSDFWRRAGQTPPSNLMDARHLNSFPASLADREAPPHPHDAPIRPVAWNQQIGTVPAWLQEPRTRPRVYVTFGTIVFGYVDALRSVVQGLGSLDVDALVTVHLEGDPHALDPLPPRVRVERFVPQSEVLDHVDAVVHHGGTGTMLSALARGLPQVVVPQGADQFQNTATLMRAGATRSLIGPEVNPGAVAAAVSAVLADGPERAATARLQREINAMPSPSEVAGSLSAVTA